MQSLAAGGEIVCTDAVWKAPGAREQVGRRLEHRRERAALKGVGEKVAVTRIRVGSRARSGR